MGKLQDFVKSIVRYVKNNYDGYKQVCEISYKEL